MDDASAVNELETAAQIRKNLPDSRFVQLREGLAVRPQEVREVAELAKLSLDEERLIFLPTVDVTKDIRMTTERGRMRLRQRLILSTVSAIPSGSREMLEDLDLLSEASSRE